MSESLRRSAWMLAVVAGAYVLSFFHRFAPAGIAQDLAVSFQTTAASLGVLDGLGFREAGRRIVEAPARGTSYDCLVLRLEKRAFVGAASARATGPAARPLPSMSQQRREDPRMTRALALAADQ